MTTVRIPPNKKYLPKHKHNYPFQNSTTIERHNGDDSDSATPLLHRRELIPSTLREWVYTLFIPHTHLFHQIYEEFWTKRCIFKIATKPFKYMKFSSKYFHQSIQILYSSYKDTAYIRIDKYFKKIVLLLGTLRVRGFVRSRVTKGHRMRTRS